MKIKFITLTVLLLFLIVILINAQRCIEDGTNDALFISYNIPEKIIINESFELSFLVKNTGTTEWSAKENYKLATVDDKFFFGINRIELEPNEVIKPGDTKEFKAICTADKVGVFSSQWQMKIEGDKSFGGIQSVSTEVLPGQIGGSRYLLGAYEALAVSIWKSDNGFNWEKYLNDLSSYNLNYTQIRLIPKPSLKSEFPSQFNNLKGPWIIENDEYKFDRWDDDFWIRVDKFLTKTKELGLIVEVYIFDEETNNLIPVEERYPFIQKVVSEILPHDNVIFNLCHGCGLSSELQILYNELQGKGKIAIDDDSSPIDGVSDNYVDLVDFHHCDPTISLEEKLNTYRSSKPFSQSEDCLESTVYNPDENRKTAWISFTGGAYNLHTDFFTWRGTSNSPSSTPTYMLQFFKNLLNFNTENKVRYNELNPYKSPYDGGGFLKTWTNNAYVTEKGGEIYIVYFYKIGDILQTVVALPKGSYNYKWFDPKNGKYVSSGTIEGGDNIKIVTPNFSPDIVLIIKKI